MHDILQLHIVHFPHRDPRDVPSCAPPIVAIAAGGVVTSLSTNCNGQVLLGDEVDLKFTIL